MSDGDNLENQEKRPQPPKRSLKDIFSGPPVQSRITEPELEAEREALEDKPKTTNSQEAQEILFREAAKRLAREEKEIYELALEHGELSILESPDFYFDIYDGNVSINMRTKDISREDLSSGETDAVRVHFYYSAENKPVNLSSKAGIDSRCDLRVDIFSDIDTRDKFLKHVANLSNQGGPSSIYYFNESGDYRKLQQTDPSFNSGKEYVTDRKAINFYSYSRPIVAHQAFKSQTTPEDFELAGRALGLIKEKLLTALGRNPDNPSIPQVMN